jgi:porin
MLCAEIQLGLMLTLLLVLMSVPDAAMAQEAARKPSFWNQGTLTNGWFGGGRQLARHGFFLDAGVTNVYQYNMNDGLDDDTGQYAGSYDLELSVDLDTAIGLSSTQVYMLGEGSWREDEGFDAERVGSLFGVNADEAPDDGFTLSELWLQRSFLGHKLKLRLGKLDLTGGFECRGCPVTFDSNRFANDETAQFLNGALVNNPTVPFPDSGLAAVLFANPVPWAYLSASFADAEADVERAGFDTAFDGDDEYISLFEAGIVPMIQSTKGRLHGAYRFGLWQEYGDQELLQGTGSESSDTGFYLSLDQMLWLENTIDSQGLGVFGRAGWADEDVNEIEVFASAGLHYQGLVPGRDDDVLGIGFAWGGLSDHAGFSAGFERVVEVYYNVQVTPWLHISPDLQVVSNPGGDEKNGDAVVAGIRVQLDI